MGSTANAAWSLVVGGSRGVGAAAVLRLAHRGLGQLLTYRTDVLAAEAVGRAALEAGAPWSRTQSLDLADPAACEATTTALVSELGPPTSVVLSGAQLLRASVADTSVEDFANVMATNCTSPYAIARASGLAMRLAGAGSIVVVSSVIGPFGVRDRVAYATSKAGLLGMTKALAIELAPQVRVNAVMLGTFATDMSAGLQADPPALQSLVSRVPLGRLGTAEEAARVIALLSEPDGFATGAVWEVDGGTTARLATPSGDPLSS